MKFKYSILLLTLIMTSGCSSNPVKPDVDYEYDVSQNYSEQQSHQDEFFLALLSGIVQVAIEGVICGVLTGHSCYHSNGYYIKNSHFHVSSTRVSHSTFK